MKSCHTMAICAAVSLVTTLASPSQAGIVADSVADFSSTQGHRNWYYGYYDGYAGTGSAYRNDDYAPLGYFDGSSWRLSGWWTMLWDTGGHPHYDRGGWNLWSVRRWVPTVTGDYTISGYYADGDWSWAGASDGVNILAISSNQILWETYVNNCSSSTPYSFNVHLTKDQPIDFALNGGWYNGGADATYWTIQLATVPEPASLALLSLAGLMLLRRR